MLGNYIIIVISEKNMWQRWPALVAPSKQKYFCFILPNYDKETIQ